MTRSDEIRLPRAADPAMLAVLLVAVALQALLWSRLEGYQLADCVEYLDRAQQIVAGRRLDPGTARSFAFSALLTPFFALSKAAGAASSAWVVPAVRLVEMTLGLATILAVARIGTRLASRRAGLAAALVLAVNPVFLRYTIAPLSGPLAMLLVALALEALLQPGGFRRGLRGGLLLGGGVLVAFQVLPIAGATVVALLVRDRRRGLPLVAGALAGIGVGLLIQSSLDAFVYAGFGSSLATYTRVNTSSILTRVLYNTGFQELAADVYAWGAGGEAVMSSAADGAATADVRERQPANFYRANFHAELLPWLLTPLLAVGALRLVRQRLGAAWLLAFVLLTNVFLLTQKGSKSYRLVLPLLPVLALLVGVGWDAVMRRRDPERPATFFGSTRRLLASAYLLVALAFSVRMGLALNLKAHGGYWRAMQYVSAASAQRAPSAAQRVRVASAYYWAVAFRDSADVEVVKLPRALLAWDRLDAADRAQLFEALDTLDWFVGHMNLLWRSPELMQALNERFTVEHFDYDAPTFDGLAPVCVLKRRGVAPSPGDRTFFGRSKTPPAAPNTAGVKLAADGPTVASTPTVFAGPDGLPWVEFSGVTVEPGLADDEVCWTTLAWRALRPDLPPLAIQRSFADPDGRELLLGYRGPWAAYGALPSETWQAGEWIHESYPLLVPTSALAFGGAYARGASQPVRVSVGLALRSEDGQPVALRPLAADGSALAEAPAARAAEAPGACFPHAGRLWDRAGRTVVAGFWIPVPAEARVPDDGRPLTGR